jgi:hypothetical protein
MPELPATGRRYIENTARARLATPGVELFRRASGGMAARVVLVALAAAVILAAMLWLAR